MPNSATYTLDGIVLSSAAGLGGAVTEETATGSEGIAVRRLVAPVRARETLIMPFTKRGHETSHCWLALADAERDWLDWALVEAGLRPLAECLADGAWGRLSTPLSLCEKRSPDRGARYRFCLRAASSRVRHAIRVDAPTFHSEAEAEAEARQRNHALVDAGKGYSDFWVERELPNGQWTVEYCQVRIPWYRRLLRGIWESLFG